MSRTSIFHCDIKDCDGKVTKPQREISVMFDHDQEDGKRQTQPYLEILELDLCDVHWLAYLKSLPYGYGAMGFNTYIMPNQKEAKK